MHALVTGAAGFIGSHLVDELLANGARVRGVDAFTDYYDVAQKRANVSSALRSDSFTLVERDLQTADVDELLDGVDIVFHQAGQPGVRSSWAEGFTDYVGNNIVVTQRLLEAARHRPLQRFVYASSSSIYGKAARYPTRETDVPAPSSPYGVTKLAGEHLTTLYGHNHGVPTVSLRYFSVYGPRQRPDMAIHRMVEAGRSRKPYPSYGDGSHVRDFTFVTDVVKANLLAATAPVEPGIVANIAAGSTTTMTALLDLVSATLGAEVPVERLPEQSGDVHQTGGDVTAAEELLGWRPETTLADGVKAQIAWHEARC